MNVQIKKKHNLKTISEWLMNIIYFSRRVR